MKKWKKHGLIWAGILYTITMVVFPLLDGEGLKAVKLIAGIPLWIITGLIIVYLFYKNKKAV